MVTKLLANTSKHAVMDRMRTMFKPMNISGGQGRVIQKEERQKDE
jgi:hypothetical protein